MEEDPLLKLTMQQINEAFETIAPMAMQDWNEALDDDELWRDRVRMQTVLTRPWWLPLVVWMPVVSVRQWRLRRVLKRMSR